jgi:hypothetical protein
MGQAFWVYSLAGGSLTIHEQAKTLLTGEFYRDKESEREDQLVIRLTNSKMMDQAILKVHKGATKTFEVKYDLPKLWNPEMNVYLLDAAASEMLRHTVNDIPASTRILIGVNASEPGDYELSFKNTENFTYGKDLYLVDQYEGTTTPVTTDTHYTFTIYNTSTPTNNRFYLTLRPQDVTRLERPLQAYPNPVSDVLTLQSPNDKASSAYLYNQQGKLITSYSWIGVGSLSMQDLPTGVYVLKVKSEYGVEVRKIVKN